MAPLCSYTCLLSHVPTHGGRSWQIPFPLQTELCHTRARVTRWRDGIQIDEPSRSEEQKGKCWFRGQGQVEEMGDDAVKPRMVGEEESGDVFGAEAVDGEGVINWRDTEEKIRYCERRL